MDKSVAVLSGGLDSAVSLALARETSEVILGLTFRYGQRSEAREIAAAAAVCRHYGLAHQAVDLPFLADITRTALVNRVADLPSPSDAALDDPILAGDSARAVWVPNRNGLFLSAAACYAESMGAQLLVTGFNAEEGITFPDNTPEFLEAVNESFRHSTASGVRAVSPVAGWDKARILTEALRLALPLEYLWSCYRGGERPCGLCESCKRLLRACRQIHCPELWNQIGIFQEN